MSDEPDPLRSASELPDELADRFAEELLHAAGSEREERVRRWVEATPEHAHALRRLAAELDGVERLLADAWPDATPELPTHIDGHRVIRRLGEGAFGIVYLCTQERRVVREVAIKVLRPGIGDDATLRRFAAERQLLASLNHPAITQIFDAGTLPDGRPYFVMEYVAGQTFRRYAEDRGLACPERLRLFIDLCRGVAHAHARGIVHRDLKPTNVLIVESEHGPAPKIIDFGIAKALFTLASTCDDPRTDAGRVIGTPGYMSPEQLDGRSREVDERTDVFALGVMLYELLTGCLPWEGGDRATSTTPLRPSQRLSTSPAPRPAPPPAEPRRVRAAELRGDLDWITMKALAGDREERYASAADLADDIERHLVHEPIVAGPPSLLYRLRKAGRRHPTALAWTAIASIVVLGTAALALRFHNEAVTSEDARLSAVSDAVAALGRRAASPDMEDASDATVRELLRDALRLHERALGERPSRPDLRRQRVGLLEDLAAICFVLGDFRQAIDAAFAARSAAEDLIALDPTDGIRALRAAAVRELARSHYMIGDYETARRFGDAAVAELEELHGRDPRAHAKVLAKTLVEFGSANGRCGDPDAHLAAQTRAFEVLGPIAELDPGNGEVQRDLVRFQCGLATITQQRGDLAAAEAALLRALTLVETSTGVTDEERALVDFRLARLYATLHQPDRAIDHAERARERTTALLARHPRRQQEQANLVSLHRLLFEQSVAIEDWAAADDHANAILRMPADLSGRASLRAADALVGMARTVMDLGPGDLERLRRAEAWLAVACERLGALGADPAAAPLRIEAATLHGNALGELGEPWSPSAWLDLSESARNAGLDAYASFALLSASNAHLDRGEIESARTVLDEAAGTGSTAIGQRDLERRTLAIEIAAARPDAAAAAAERLLACDPTVDAVLAAAVGLARSSHVVRSDDPAAATAYRARAVELLTPLASPDESPDVPRLLRAQARACLATLETGAVAATLRSASLPVLEELRGRVPASQWREELWLAAHLDSALLELDDGRLDEALSDLEALASRLVTPGALVELCTALAACRRAEIRSEPAPTGDTGRAVTVGISALGRAIELGLRGRQRVMGRPDLRWLVECPGFAALGATIPDTP